MRYKKNVISNLSLQIVTIILGFFTSIIIAKGLGVENQGLFSYFLLIFGLIASYGHIGITSSNSYFIKKSNFDREKVINNNISCLIILSALYTLITFFCKNQIFNTNSSFLTFVWVIYFISLIFTSFFSTVYISDEKIYIFNKVSMIINIVKGFLIIILYYLGRFDILVISLIYSIVEFLKLVIVIINLKPRYKMFLSIKILKKEFLYGFVLYMAALLIYLNYRADLFMVKKILGQTQLGIYSISVHLAELAFIFPTALITAFEGRLYSCKNDERRITTIQTIKLSFYITLVICLIGICCYPLVQILYGNEYSNAALPMIILLIGIIFASIGKVAPTYYYTQGKPNIHLIVSAIVLVINIVFNALLIPRFGINGAAFASTISYTFYGLIYLIMLKRSGFKYKELLSISINEVFKIKDKLLNKK